MLDLKDLFRRLFYVTFYSWTYVDTWADLADKQVEESAIRSLRRRGYHKGPIRRIEKESDHGPLLVIEADIPLWRVWRARFCGWLFRQCLKRLHKYA